MEQGKNPPDQTNEEEIGSLPKRIQSNDSKDDPKSRKQNGENTRNVKQGPRRTKEQTNKDEQYNK